MENFSKKKVIALAVLGVLLAALVLGMNFLHRAQRAVHRRIDTNAAARGCKRSPNDPNGDDSGFGPAKFER